MKEIKRGGKIFGYIITLTINILLIWIVIKLPDWISFLTQSYAAIMWLLIISFIANIIANFTYIFYDEKRFKSLIEFIKNVYSLLVTYIIYIIFPFDFSTYTTNWTIIVKILLIIGMVGVGIGAIVEVVKIFKPEGSKK